MSSLMKVTTRKKCTKQREDWHQLASNPGKLMPYYGVLAAQANQPVPNNPIFPFPAHISFELDLTWLQTTRLSYVHTHT